MAVARSSTFLSGAALRPRRVQRRATAASAARAEKSSYPEWGKSPYDGDWEDLPWAGWADDKSEEEIATYAAQELLHARWAMLGTAGAWSAEQGTGINWFQAGKVCTPEDCTAVNSIFPGQVLKLAPEGLPSFQNVFALTVIAMTLAEFYRTGVIKPVFKGYAVGDMHPGGRFDPLGMGDKFGGLERMKLAEIKNGRLAMFAWAGYVAQAFATNPGEGLPSFVDGAPGPYANWQAHVASPFTETVWKYL